VLIAVTIYKGDKMQNLKTFRFIVILMSASLLAACGQAALLKENPTLSAVAPTAAPVAKANPATTSSTSPKVSACVLLTKDDVSKVLGQPIQTAEEKGLGGVCSYKSNNLSIDLTVTHTGGTKFLQQNRAKLGVVRLTFRV